MRLRTITVISTALLFGSTVAAFAGPHVRRGPTAQRTTRGRGSRSARVVPATHITMAPERAVELQTALIKAGYLSGSPSGAWDSPSQAAMEKLQADNGWQTKLVPDSRAIIKLGLGPNATLAVPNGPADAETGLSSASSADLHPVVE